MTTVFCRAILIALGLSWPFFAVQNLSANSGWDLYVFQTWADCWSERIYETCRPNYPIVGLALSAGVIRAIEASVVTDQATAQLYFRYFLAIFDALNFLLIVWLARLMGFRWPAFIGLVILLTPSTWVGGAGWGQIDNIALFFCLLALIGFIKSWGGSDAAMNEKSWRSGMWLLLAALSLALYVLTKQLAVFSLPLFVIVTALTVRIVLQRFPREGLPWLLVVAMAAALSFLSLDSLFAVPEPFHGSSYWFVWKGGGSDHADKISRNGFNIWMFLGRDMESSSHVNFLNFQIWKWRDHLSPYKAGFLLYALFMLFLLLTGWKKLWSLGRCGGLTVWDGRKEMLVALLSLFHGLSHLGFNVLLSGTHERYLYLGYPFLLLAAAWFYRRRIVFSWRPAAFTFVSGAAYGGFVYGINRSLPQLLFVLRRHEFLASMHLFLLVILSDLWVQTVRHESRVVTSLQPER